MIGETYGEILFLDSHYLLTTVYEKKSVKNDIVAARASQWQSL